MLDRVVPRPQTIAVERCNEPEIRIYCRINEKFKPQISHSKWFWLTFGDTRLPAADAFY